MVQLEDEDSEIEPVKFNLSMPILKELGAKWFIPRCLNTYISNNPQFSVRGFIKAGICGALDGSMNEDNGASSEETV